MFCRHWLAQLEQLHDQLQEAGLHTVVVGLGEPKHAAHFGPRLAPSVTCLTFPTPEAHAAFGIGRATLAGLTDTGLARATFSALAGGHMQGRATGDASILSGTFLIDPDGVVRFAHYAGFPGDDPDLEEVLDAARALTPEVKA